MSRELASEAYRSLLRATRIAFHGDLHTLFAARAQVREKFEHNRNLATDSAEWSQQISYAQEVAKFIRENIVQGQAVGGDKYKLRIHEHTERGDNEDIKKGKDKTWSEGVKCCSS